jgi:hypothetical protein
MVTSTISENKKAEPESDDFKKVVFVNSECENSVISILQLMNLQFMNLQDVSESPVKSTWSNVSPEKVVFGSSLTFWSPARTTE